MDSFDIYGDLENFDALQKLRTKNEEYDSLQDKYVAALKKIEQLEAERKELQVKIENMERNFSSLLFTARTEIKRKESQINELRREKDDICFRRNERHNKNIENRSHSYGRDEAAQKGRNPFAKRGAQKEETSSKHAVRNKVVHHRGEHSKQLEYENKERERWKSTNESRENDRKHTGFHRSRVEIESKVSQKSSLDLNNSKTFSHKSKESDKTQNVMKVSRSSDLRSKEENCTSKKENLYGNDETRARNKKEEGSALREHPITQITENKEKTDLERRESRKSVEKNLPEGRTSKMICISIDEMANRKVSLEKTSPKVINPSPSSSEQNSKEDNSTKIERRITLSEYRHRRQVKDTDKEKNDNMSTSVPLIVINVDNKNSPESDNKSLRAEKLITTSLEDNQLLKAPVNSEQSKSEKNQESEDQVEEITLVTTNMESVAESIDEGIDANPSQQSDKDKIVEDVEKKSESCSSAIKSSSKKTFEDVFFDELVYDGKFGQDYTDKEDCGNMSEDEQLYIDLEAANESPMLAQPENTSKQEEKNSISVLSVEKSISKAVKKEDNEMRSEINIDSTALSNGNKEGESIQSKPVVVISQGTDLSTEVASNSTYNSEYDANKSTADKNDITDTDVSKVTHNGKQSLEMDSKEADVSHKLSEIKSVDNRNYESNSSISESKDDEKDLLIRDKEDFIEVRGNEVESTEKQSEHGLGEKIFVNSLGPGRSSTPVDNARFFGNQKNSSEENKSNNDNSDKKMDSVERQLENMFNGTPSKADITIKTPEPHKTPKNSTSKAQEMFELYLASPTNVVPSEVEKVKSKEKTPPAQIISGTKKRKSSTPRKSPSLNGRVLKLVGHRIEGFEPGIHGAEALQATKLKNALFKDILGTEDITEAGGTLQTNSSSTSNNGARKSVERKTTNNVPKDGEHKDEAGVETSTSESRSSSNHSLSSGNRKADEVDNKVDKMECTQDVNTFKSGQISLRNADNNDLTNISDGEIDMKKLKYDEKDSKLTTFKQSEKSLTENEKDLNTDSNATIAKLILSNIQSENTGQVEEVENVQNLTKDDSLSNVVKRENEEASGEIMATTEVDLRSSKKNGDKNTFAPENVVDKKAATKTEDTHEKEDKFGKPADNNDRSSDAIEQTSSFENDQVGEGSSHSKNSESIQQSNDSSLSGSPKMNTSRKEKVEILSIVTIKPKTNIGVILDNPFSSKHLINYNEIQENSNAEIAEATSENLETSIKVCSSSQQEKKDKDKKIVPENNISPLSINLQTTDDSETKKDTMQSFKEPLSHDEVIEIATSPVSNHYYSDVSSSEGFSNSPLEVKTNQTNLCSPPLKKLDSANQNTSNLCSAGENPEKANGKSIQRFVEDFCKSIESVDEETVSDSIMSDQSLARTPPLDRFNFSTPVKHKEGGEIQVFASTDPNISQVCDKTIEDRQDKSTEKKLSQTKELSGSSSKKSEECISYNETTYSSQDENLKTALKSQDRGSKIQSRIVRFECSFGNSTRKPKQQLKRMKYKGSLKLSAIQGLRDKRKRVGGILSANNFNNKTKESSQSEIVDASSNMRKSVTGNTFKTANFKGNGVHSDTISEDLNLKWGYSSQSENSGSDCRKRKISDSSPNRVNKKQKCDETKSVEKRHEVRFTSNNSQEDETLTLEHDVRVIAPLIAENVEKLTNQLRGINCSEAETDTITVIQPPQKLLPKIDASKMKTRESSPKTPSSCIRKSSRIKERKRYDKHGSEQHENCEYCSDQDIMTNKSKKISPKQEGNTCGNYPKTVEDKFVELFGNSPIPSPAPKEIMEDRTRASSSRTPNKILPKNCDIAVKNVVSQKIPKSQNTYHTEQESSFQRPEALYFPTHDQKLNESSERRTSKGNHVPPTGKSERNESRKKEGGHCDLSQNNEEEFVVERDSLTNKENVRGIKRSHPGDTGSAGKDLSLDKSSKSSALNDSGGERKNLSTSWADYVIESVSSDVVNVFITRKKRKKKVV